MLVSNPSIPRSPVLSTNRNLPVDTKAFVRLCQFHAIEAILSWNVDSNTKGDNHGISLLVKYQVTEAFRSAQRCNKRSEWPQFEERFFAEVREAIYSQQFQLQEPNDGADAKTKRRRALAAEDRKAAQYMFLYNYFKNNWFTDAWIGELPLESNSLISRGLTCIRYSDLHRHRSA